MGEDKSKCHKMTQDEKQFKRYQREEPEIWDDFVAFVVRVGMDEQPKWFSKYNTDRFGHTATYYYYRYHYGEPVPDWMLHELSYQDKDGYTIQMDILLRRKEEFYDTISEETRLAISHDPTLKSNENLTCAHYHRRYFPDMDIPDHMMYDGFEEDFHWKDNLTYFVFTCSEKPGDFDPLFQDKDGFTPAMVWVVRKKCAPPEWMYHDPVIRSSDHHTFFMIWHKMIKNVECPEPMRHDPGLVNTNQETALVMYFDTRDPKPEELVIFDYLVPDRLYMDKWGLRPSERWVSLTGAPVPDCLMQNESDVSSPDDLSEYARKKISKWRKRDISPAAIGFVY